MSNKYILIFLSLCIHLCLTVHTVFQSFFNISPDADLLIYSLANFSLLKNEIPPILFLFRFRFALILLSLLFSLLIVNRNKMKIYFFYLLSVILLYFFLNLNLKNQAGEVNYDYTHLKYLNEGKIRLPEVSGIQKNDLIKDFNPDSSPNIIFFILESVNSESFSRAKNSRELTENANITVDHFFVPVPHTSSSVYSLMYGEYGSHGFRKDINTHKNKMNLTKLLHSRGYRSYFLTSGPLHFDNMYNYLAHLPMEIRDMETYKKKYPDKEGFEWGLDDKILIRETESILSSEKNPILSYYFFSNTHSPYLADGADPVDRFRAALEYDLSVLKEIMDRIRQRNPNSVFIILGDHGESFGENGFYKHGFSLYNTEIKVPFYMFLPGSSKKKHIDSGTILDVNRSIMSLFGTVTDSSEPSRNFFAKNYSLQLNLRTWGDAGFRGLIVDRTKWIFNYRDGILYKMDLDDDHLLEISRSKYALEFGSRFKYLLD